MRQQRDDEVRTSLVPERSEDKTIVMKQQYLPFTILKRLNIKAISLFAFTVVIALPFTVLKPFIRYFAFVDYFYYSCNSTYRLRYAPQSVWQQRSKVTMRAAHLLPEQSEGKTKVMRK